MPQGVHVGGAVLERVPGALEEAPAAVEEHRRRERELDVRIPQHRDEVAQGAARSGQQQVPHGAHDERHREGERDVEPAADVRHLGLARGRPPIGQILIAGQGLGPVPGLRHRLGHPLGRDHPGDVVHGHALGCGVHLRPLHAPQPLDKVLDRVDGGDVAHPAQEELGARGPLLRARARRHLGRHLPRHLGILRPAVGLDDERAAVHVHGAGEGVLARAIRRELDGRGRERRQRAGDPEIGDHHPVGAICGLPAVEPEAHRQTGLHGQHVRLVGALDTDRGLLHPGPYYRRLAPLGTEEEPQQEGDQQQATCYHGEVDNGHVSLHSVLCSRACPALCGCAPRSDTYRFCVATRHLTSVVPPVAAPAPDALPFPYGLSGAARRAHPRPPGR